MSPVMSTPELERRLGEVLRQHAEDAMDSTDTQTRFEELEHDLRRNRPRTRIGWVAAAAAAAAVIAALVVVDASRDDGSGTPAGPVDEGAATELASDFVDAVAAYDADRAASYLADDARIELRPPPWTPSRWAPTCAGPGRSGSASSPGDVSSRASRPRPRPSPARTTPMGSVRNGWAGVRSRTTSSG